MQIVLCLCALLIAASATAQPQAAAPTSCVACHANASLLSEDHVRVVVEGMRDDVHATVGLSCHDCHGGNPDPSLADDIDAAKDASLATNPFRGAPSRQEIPEFCGRCHSDPVFMKRYKPDARVDQVTEYWTSHHGRALKQGRTQVATCVDCHGVHGILRPSDPRAPVYPTRVGTTCSRCHGDPEHMRGTMLPDGRAIPTDQFARWQRSVHANAMFEKGDLSAPTCNDCHGNHGATPPGLDSVSFVCGNCHGREATIFRASPKSAGFAAHAELLADAGPDRCRACHEAPDPPARLQAPVAFSECVTCHGNHSVVRPTVAMLSPLPEWPCAFCHEGDAVPVAEPKKSLQNYGDTLSGLLAEATALGLEGERLFDWMVDRALTLPPHTLPGSESESGVPQNRPEFARLFEKFRIGKIHFTFEDPISGATVEDRVRRCSDCHAEEPLLADEGVGLRVARGYVQQMNRLTGATARAERILLRAKRGGVETREGLNALDQAVDRQIELEVLVHDFRTDSSSTFMEKHADGLASATEALNAGQRALDELDARRLGLEISLGFVILVLIGLGLKIRQGSGQSAAPPRID